MRCPWKHDKDRTEQASLKSAAVQASLMAPSVSWWAASRPLSRESDSTSAVSSADRWYAAAYWMASCAPKRRVVRKYMQQDGMLSHHSGVNKSIQDCRREALQGALSLLLPCLPWGVAETGHHGCRMGRVLTGAACGPFMRRICKDWRGPRLAASSQVMPSSVAARKLEAASVHSARAAPFAEQASRASSASRGVSSFWCPCKPLPLSEIRQRSAAHTCSVFLCCPPAASSTLPW